MPAFSPAIAATVSPRYSAWSRPIGRDDGGGGRVDHVGGVDPAAEADLEEEHVGGRLGEQQQGRRGGDLEEGDRVAAVGRLAAREGVGQAVLRHELAAPDGAEPDALVEAHEMRRGVDVDAPSPPPPGSPA